MKQSKDELKAMNQLRAEGYYVIKSAGSFGLWDIVAWLKDSIRLIQVKRNQGPRSFERKALTEYPHLNCPKCGHRLSSKEIWLYKRYERGFKIELLGEEVSQ
ncbi:MAG: hypothetical protein JW734_06555 [Candidatus Omnitrophica bacterium]|nr:hypothetical protein [Candidatus Omnitrophota bacterium]